VYSVLIKCPKCINIGFIYSGNMPLIFHKTVDDQTTLAVWQVQETNDYFLAELKLTAEEKEAYDLMKKHRQREWLSSRYLVHVLRGDKNRLPISKTEHGEPFIANQDQFLSISHSKAYTAAILSDKKVGIDIQMPEPKINKIAPKFVSHSEMKRIPREHQLDYYHILWGAKESMYKAYALKQLDFRGHMHVYPFIYSDGPIEFKGQIEKYNLEQAYNLYMQKVEAAYLVYSILDKQITHEDTNS